jgi:peptidoglycan hydrolase-like protein with peptidoglycan-binding domain
MTPMDHRILAAVLTAGALAITPALAQTSRPQTAAPSSSTQMPSSSSSQMPSSSSSSSSSAATSPSQLTQQQVMEIQTKLKQENVYNGKADGRWGPESEQALKQFQQKNNLPATGQLDEETMAQLGIGGGNAPSSASGVQTQPTTPSQRR